MQPTTAAATARGCRGYFALLGHGLDRCRHRTFAALDLIVLAERVNLVALELGVLSGGGEQDGTPASVDLFGELKALFYRIAENLMDHIDDVFERMVLVVP